MSDVAEATTADRRARRPEKTYSKHVMLTELGRQRIEAWAAAQQINFSAAIETLALIGLEDPRSEYAIPALRAVALQALRLSFNRFARLLSDTAIEAATARTVSEALFLQQLRGLAAEYPDDFEARLRVRRGAGGVEQRVRRLHDEIKTGAEREALRRLKRATDRVEALFEDGEDAP